MDLDHDNFRLAVNVDRLSSLPDELFHQILSCIDDTKFIVQTCLLVSPRWNLLWKSVPRLNFFNNWFRTQAKFSKFVTNILSHCNPQVEVASVKLRYHGAANQAFVKKIANYAFSHNIQELIVISDPKNHYEYPPCLFSSPSLKHFTLSSYLLRSDLTPKIPKAPWNIPALTTLHLSEITLCEDEREYLDLFSNCVNLKNLTLKRFNVWAKVFDIITPRLSTLLLVECSGSNSTVINVFAPQLEYLSINGCSINHLEAPPGLSSLCYMGYDPSKWFEDCFRSLNRVTLYLYFHNLSRLYTEEDARKTIIMLERLQSVRFLTLNIDIVECLSSYPDLLSHRPSPYSNLIRLKIDSSMRRDAYKVKMATEVRNFLLENSPWATFIMDLPEEPPTKAMKVKEASEKTRASLVADIESSMLELQSSLLEQEIMLVERKQTKEKTKLAIKNLMAELHVLTKIKIMQNEPEKAHSEELVAGMKARISTHLEEIRNLSNQAYHDAIEIRTKNAEVGLLVDGLAKRQRADMKARYSHQLEETEKLSKLLISLSASSEMIYSRNQSLLQQLSEF